MMKQIKRRPTLFAAVLLSLLVFAGSGRAPAVAAEPEQDTLSLTAYRQGDWLGLLKQNRDKPLIVHFWGLTCGPCLEELPAWGVFNRKNADLALVTVQVDQVPEAMIVQTLVESDLTKVDHRLLVDAFDEYVRAEVDPRWMGELPLTLLVDARGKVTRMRGKVNFETVQKWLGSAGR